MAFNPFHQFRRHNKKMFAALAIVCMFTFVLSSGMGRGDWFDQIGNWLGGRGNVNRVLTVAGKEFDARQVDQIRIQRSLASEYMDQAVGASQAALIGRVNAGKDKLDPSAKEIVDRIIESKILAAMIPTFSQQYINNVVRNTPIYDQMLARAIALAQGQNKTDDVDVLTSVRVILIQDFRQMGRTPGDSYFGGPIRERDFSAAADFIMWLHLADQLGIKLTPKDVQQVIADETFYGLKAESAAQIDKRLRDNYQGYSVDGLYAALGDELRARIAQSAYLGIASVGTKTRTDYPAVVTPEEEWELFKDARTTIRAGLIALPVDSFVSKVTDKPADDELKKLFDAHKNDEPAPMLERPGFKEPRRIQVEWVSGKPDAPFYQKAASQLTPVFQTMRLFGMANPLDAAIAPLALDFEQYAAMRDYQFAESSWNDVYYQRMHDISLIRPENLKSLIGGTLGAVGTGAPVLSGPLTFEGSAIASEVLERAKLGSGLIGFGSADPLGSAAAALAMTPQPLGLDVLRQPLREKASAKLATGLLHADLQGFRAKVIELGKELEQSQSVPRLI